MIDLVDSMDCCNPLEFPKSRYSFLKNKITKPRYKQNTNTNSWEELLAAIETSRTSHHSPCSSIIPRSKINTLPPWIHCAADCFCTFPRYKDLQTSLPQLFLSATTQNQNQKPDLYPPPKSNNLASLSSSPKNFHTKISSPSPSLSSLKYLPYHIISSKSPLLITLQKFDPQSFEECSLGCSYFLPS